MGILADNVLFVDTNVLLAATDESCDQHRDAQTLLRTASQVGLGLAISGQVVREYLVVATRSPDSNGLGLTTADALVNIRAFLNRCVLHGETTAVAQRLQDLVRRYELRGKHIHDANIVATMVSYGISGLVTQDPGDFGSFAEITTATVEAVVQALHHRGTA